MTVSSISRTTPRTLRKAAPRDSARLACNLRRKNLIAIHDTAMATKNPARVNPTIYTVLLIGTGLALSAELDLEWRYGAITSRKESEKRKKVALWADADKDSECLKRERNDRRNVIQSSLLLQNLEETKLFQVKTRRSSPSMIPLPSCHDETRT